MLKTLNIAVEKILGNPMSRRRKVVPTLPDDLFKASFAVVGDVNSADIRAAHIRDPAHSDDCNNGCISRK